MSGIRVKPATDPRHIGSLDGLLGILVLEAASAVQHS
jgi:hypothetical protein